MCRVLLSLASPLLPECTYPTYLEKKFLTQSGCFVTLCQVREECTWTPQELNGGQEGGQFKTHQKIFHSLLSPSPSMLLWCAPRVFCFPPLCRALAVTTTWAQTRWWTNAGCAVATTQAVRLCRACSSTPLPAWATIAWSRSPKEPPKSTSPRCTRATTIWVSLVFFQRKQSVTLRWFIPSQERDTVVSRCPWTWRRCHWRMPKHRLASSLTWETWVEEISEALANKYLISTHLSQPLFLPRKTWLCTRYWAKWFLWDGGGSLRSWGTGQSSFYWSSNRACQWSCLELHSQRSEVKTMFLFFLLHLPQDNGICVEYVCIFWTAADILGNIIDIERPFLPIFPQRVRSLLILPSGLLADCILCKANWVIRIDFDQFLIHMSMHRWVNELTK